MVKTKFKSRILLLFFCQVLISLAFLSCGGSSGGTASADDPDDGTLVSDEDAVIEDAESLEITFGGSDSADSVSQSITLPSEGDNGSTITWASDDESVIAADGTVTRPAFGSDSVVVTLTATISKGDFSETKDFTVTVLPAQQTDEASVAEDKANLKITFGGTDTADSVTQNLTLPTSGSNGTTISWNSTDSNRVSTTGKVTRPAYADSDVKVTLTATISKGVVSDTGTFDLTVKKATTPAPAVSPTVEIKEFDKVYTVTFKPNGDDPAEVYATFDAIKDFEYDVYMYDRWSDSVYTARPGAKDVFYSDKTTRCYLDSYLGEGAFKSTKSDKIYIYAKTSEKITKDETFGIKVVKGRRLVKKGVSVVDRVKDGDYLYSLVKPSSDTTPFPYTIVKTNILTGDSTEIDTGLTVKYLAAQMYVKGSKIYLAYRLAGSGLDTTLRFKGSTDGGTTWSAEKTVASLTSYSAYAGVISMAVVEETGGDNIYVITDNAAESVMIYKSLDGGTTFNPANGLTISATKYTSNRYILDYKILAKADSSLTPDGDDLTLILIYKGKDSGTSKYNYLVNYITSTDAASSDFSAAANVKLCGGFIYDTDPSYSYEITGMNLEGTEKYVTYAVSYGSDTSYLCASIDNAATWQIDYNYSAKGFTADIIVAPNTAAKDVYLFFQNTTYPNHLAYRKSTDSGITFGSITSPIVDISGSNFNLKFDPATKIVYGTYSGDVGLYYFASVLQ